VPRRGASAALKDWTALNAFLRGCSLDEAVRLLRLESAARRRTRFLLRIHSRMNRLRAAKERQAIRDKSWRG
jgi:hypothetical protein